MIVEEISCRRSDCRRNESDPTSTHPMCFKNLDDLSKLSNNQNLSYFIITDKSNIILKKAIGSFYHYSILENSLQIAKVL